jgi:putative ABC transport system ATP-binding protein
MSLVVELNQVSKRFLLGKVFIDALRGVSLKIEAGEFAGIIGPSGSGKSTLLNIAGLIDEPDSGSVVVDSTDLGLLSDDERSHLRNRRIGFVFQAFNLVSVLDVYENVELPLLLQSEIGASERHRRVEQALADVGLSEFARQLPDKMSGGQRQRAAIARALVGYPALILADEPTANLDSTTAQRVIELMLELNRKRNATFLFSTHDEKLITRIDRRIRIRDGVLES